MSHHSVRTSIIFIGLAVLLAACGAGPTKQYAPTLAAVAPGQTTPGSAAGGGTAQGDSHNLADLVTQKAVTVTIRAITVNSVSLHVENKTAKALRIDIPAGTYFVAKNASVQNMVVRHSANGSLVEASAATDINLDLACANLHSAQPSDRDTFSIVKMPEQPQLVKLLYKMDDAGLSYPVEQAAVWIVTDDATYDQLGSLVGDSQYGQPLIKETETARAMQFIDEAGLGLVKHAIWRDRWTVLAGTTEPELAKWLQDRITLADTVPTRAAGAGEISEYASLATASTKVDAGSASQTNPDFGAANEATGAPNTTGCILGSTEWVSPNGTGTDVLSLYYDKPVIPTHITVYRQLNPGAVVRVEVLDAAGNATAVYTAEPAAMEDCPAALEIDVKGVTQPVSSIRVSVDRSADGTPVGIDAVQLIGKAP